MPRRRLPITISRLHLIGVEKELTHHGVGKVTVRLFDKEEVGVVPLGSEHGEVVLGSSLTLHLAGVSVQRPRHTEMVEGRVAQRDIYLQLGSVGDQFAKPLSKHHVVVGVSQ